MTTPNQSELIFYTNKPLDDSDWSTNFLKIIEWLTSGNYDFVINDLTASNITASNNITAVGTITANSFVGNGENITGLDFQNKNWLRNGGCRAEILDEEYTLVKDEYKAVVSEFFGMATGTAVSAGTLKQTLTANIGRTGYGIRFDQVTLTGTGILYLRYRMQSKDAVNFINQIASFGCKVYHNVGTDVNYTVYIRKADSVDDFSSVTEIANSGTIGVPTATDTDLQFENVSLGNPGNGIEIEIKVECGSVTLKDFEFTELQFEIGESATSFEYTTFADKYANFKLKNSTVVDAATTTVTIAALDGDTDVEYKVDIYLVGGVDTSSGFNMYFNNDSGNNYGAQTLTAAGALVTGANATGQSLIQLSNYTNGKVNYMHLQISAKSGNLRTVLWNDVARVANDKSIGFIIQGGGVWTNTSDNVTSLEFFADTALGIAAGTIINVYKRSI